MVRALRHRGFAVEEVDSRVNVPVAQFIKWAVRAYDLVVHAAAVAPHRAAIDSTVMIFPANVALDAMMLEWASRTKQPRFLYLSSSAVYPADLQGETGWRTTGDRGFPTADLEHGGWKLGDRRLYEAQAFDGDPADTYGHTKMIGERMAAALRADGMKVTIVRPFSGYGEDQSTDFPFARFVQRAKDWQDPFSIWGSADQVRDWIHIDDVVAGALAAVDAEVDVVNLCTGRPYAVGALAQLMAHAAGYSPKIHVIENAPLGVHWRVGDPTKLHTFYTPKIELEEGVARAFAGWKRT